MSLSAVLRSLFRQPSTTVVALLVLALGIGATTAVFSVLYSVALKPLPWPDAERIVQLGDVDPSMPEMARETVFQLGNIDALREELPAFESAAGYMGHRMTLTGFDEAVRLSGAKVSVDLFRVLGVQPMVGRGFDREDARQRREDLVVISEGLASRLFEDAETAVGKTVELDGEPREVIGVMAKSFEFPEPDTEYWWPLYPFEVADGDQKREMLLPVIARLAADATPQAGQVQGQGFLDERNVRDQARSAQRNASAGGGGMRTGPEDHEGSGGEQGLSSEPSGSPAGTVVRRHMEVEEPEQLGRTFVMTSLSSRRMAPLRDSLQLLIGAVLLVFLMACTNVANLLLARGAHREREMATRLSLGATRGKLVKLLFAEGLALGLVGGVFGVGLAWAGVGLLRRLGPEDLMNFGAVELNGVVVLFAFSAAVLSTLVFSLLPALQASGARPGRALGRTGGSALGGIWRGRSKLGWLRSGLTLAQVAMAIVLLAGGGLLANSFLRLVNVDPGYQAEDLLTFRLAPPAARYQGEQRTQVFEQVAAEIASIPEVDSVGIVNFLPLFRGRIQMSMRIEGQEPPADPREAPTAEGRVASADYFETMKIRLLEGRTFTSQDRADSEPVLIVNESFVEQLLPDGSAIGKRVTGMGEIVGVVGDVLLQGLDSEPGPSFYQPLAQLDPRMAMMFGRMSFAVRTNSPMAIVPAVRARVAGVDAQLPIEDPLPMASRLSQSVAAPRFFATVLGLFAAVALILAVTGVYGVLAFNASRRAKETGIRLALGAQRGSVVRRTVFEGLGLTAMGVAFGVGLALMLSRALSSLLFGVEPGDLATLAVVSSVLLVAAGVGSLIPALRAARVDPMVVLREE